MKIMISICILISGIISLLPCTTTADEITNSFCGYFVEWGVYERNYVVADVPGDKLTHINYAFIEPYDIDQDSLFECRIIDSWAALEKPMSRVVPGTDPDLGENLGNLNQFTVLRRNYPDLKLMMSLGGWTLSGNFPVIASTETHRIHFAEFCVNFMDQYGFDGIDIDWEYPGPGDRDNFTLFLSAFRTALDTLTTTTGVYYPLTIAAPAGPSNIVNIDLAAIEPYLDRFNLMTYDFNGTWSSNTGYNSPLYASPDDPMGPLWNSHAVVETYRAAIPSNKLSLGLPYYGRGFDNLQSSGPDPDYPGRYAETVAGAPVTGTWDNTGVFDYWDIKNRFTGPFQSSMEPILVLNDYTRYYDTQQTAVAVFHPDSMGQTGYYWLSFDDPQTLAEKVSYARDLELGGVFIWELSLEGTSGSQEHPLTDAIYDALVQDDCVNSGDTTLDGVITSSDAQQAFLITLGLYLPTNEEECGADCNGDGSVTAGDAQAIFEVVLGYGTCLETIESIPD